MTNSSKARQLLEQLRDTATPALLKYAGIIGDGSGNVLVPNRTNYNYCQVNGTVLEVKNTKVPAVQGTPVMVGYSPDEPFLLKVLDARSTDTNGNTYTIQTGYAPAARYQWMAPNGGEDPIMIEMRAFLYGRLSAGVSGSPMAIQVVRNIVHTPSSGSPWTYEDNPIRDLTSYIPSQSGSACAILVTSGSSGDIVLTVGTVVPIANLTHALIPIPPAGTTQVFGAVRVYNGQSGIYEGRESATDIVDLRMSGWGQGGGGSGMNVSGSVVDGHMVGWNGTSGSSLRDIGAPSSGSGGGGGITQSYVGNPSNGTGWSSFATYTEFMKKIVLAEPCIITNIEAFLKGDGGHVASFSANIFEDESGTPGIIIATSSAPTGHNLYLSTTGRWIGVPIGKYLPSGTYWISIFSGPDGGYLNIGNTSTTTGDDTTRYINSYWSSDGFWFDPAVTTINYSVRASCIR